VPLLLQGEGLPRLPQGAQIVTCCSADGMLAGTDVAAWQSM
jgi:hypothetical protein